MQPNVCRDTIGILILVLVINKAVKMFVQAIKFKIQTLANVNALSQQNVWMDTIGTLRIALVLRRTKPLISDDLNQIIH